MNLERDAHSVDALKGYILTPRAARALERCVTSLDSAHSARAVTLTGVYGTGKSAFAQFLTALFSAAGSPARRLAEGIVAAYEEAASDALPLRALLKKHLPKQGLLTIIATARHEALSITIVRALAHAVELELKSRGRAAIPAALVREVRALAQQAVDGEPIEPSRIPALLGGVADSLDCSVALVIDELGKALEYAAEHRAHHEIYLLQQIAESLTSADGHPLLFLGLLHQTFAEYGAALSTADRTEWQKVQGRFEDVAFTEAPEHMLTLIRNALVHDAEPSDVGKERFALGRTWHTQLKREAPDSFVGTVLTSEVAADVYPLHPVAALVLPALCTKYAQHDRSLFTFLTSSEPNAFARFLRECTATPKDIPVQRIAALYDYFVNVAGHALAFRPQFQRWAEVHGIVSEARALEPDLLLALKTIATLNLVAASGPLRASRGLVLAALMQRPNDAAEREHWTAVLDALVARHIVTYRPQLDEFRVWEGSDFDIGRALQEQRRREGPTLGALLTSFAPLRPVVAQRHSFETGTLRYFERQFADQARSVDTPTPTLPDADGLVLYWVGDEPPSTIPQRTADGRPVVVVTTNTIRSLKSAVAELAALRGVAQSSPQLQTDGVARREVQTRLALAERELTHAVRSTFDLHHARVWFSGSEVRLTEAQFNARLSELCDGVYPKGVRLWNELINRRQLTSMGARARVDVLRMMLSHGSVARLGLEGHGPEASLYESVLRESGIHREDAAAGEWVFGPPLPGSGLCDVWDAIHDFCVGATTTPKSLDALFALLDAPPYGVKRGVVPLLLAAVLLVRADDVSVYYEGSFVPALGPEHFEILVRQPHLFAVKHFALRGVRWEVFRELETVVRRGDTKTVAGARNSTLLNIVRPLVRFASALPRSTRQSTTLTPAAVAVRDALMSAREPDVLLFDVLPRACGLSPLDESEHGEAAAAAALKFRKALHAALRELDGAYERQLERCATLMHHAFALKSDRTRLRVDLSSRAQYLVEGTLDRGLKSFVLAAVNDQTEEREWLEALIMIIADRPADTWTDDDAAGFEMRLSDMARRFRNLERLVQEATDTSREGFEARRVTITRPDGSELHKLVWVDHHARELIDRVLTDVREHLTGFSTEQQWAVAAAVAEAIFAGSDRPAVPMIGRAGVDSAEASRAARRRRGSAHE